jgi:transcriptional regulator with XRE-family HTH domain
MPMTERAVKHVRKFLGERLRALRKERGLSQERLGQRSRLSGKFIGEVERGEKSISIDSLYHVSVALEIPLRELTDVRSERQKQAPTAEAQKVFALITGRRASDVRRAYGVLRAMFAEKP